MRRLGALTCAGLVLAGCAGREPMPVSAYMPSDAEMTCEAVDAEIRRNNDALRARVNEDAETQNKNILVGTAAFLLFAPIALAMDFKGAASTEANSFEQRNRTLTGLATRKRCATAHAKTVAEVVAEREADVESAKVEEQADAPGVRTPTDQRLHQAGTGATPMVTRASARSAVVDRDRLRDLMDRFLSGELSKAEYERLRAG